MTSKQRSRKVSTLARLKAQLASGVKTTKKTLDSKEPLSDKDKKRIEKEINTLNLKLKTSA